MNAMQSSLVILCLASSMSGCAHENSQPSADVKQGHVELQIPKYYPVKRNSLRVHYLEIVTPKVDETCVVLAIEHGVVFGEPIAELGNARTTTLKGGGRIGVRLPLRESETPVVRPYFLVNDIEVAVQNAEAEGAEIALPPMMIPGQGIIAIYVLGGIDHGLWQAFRSTE